MHPDNINRYYGVIGPERQRQAHHSGAGHPPEEEEEDSNKSTSESEASYQDIAQGIAEDQEANIRHPPVEVPCSSSPFADDNEIENLFGHLVDELGVDEGLPIGYGVTDEELGEDGYETHEPLRIGKRGLKRMVIALPEQIWRPRTELWAKAVHIMTYLLQNIQTDE